MKKQFLPLTKQNLEGIENEYRERQKVKAGRDEWSEDANASHHGKEESSQVKDSGKEKESPVEVSSEAGQKFRNGKRVKLLHMITPLSMGNSGRKLRKSLAETKAIQTDDRTDYQ